MRDWFFFVRSGFRREYFTGGLYGHLVSGCGFPAHYSRGLFYGRYFGPDVSMTAGFLLRFITGESAGGRSRDRLEGDCAALNGIMRKIVLDRGERIADMLEDGIDNRTGDRSGPGEGKLSAAGRRVKIPRRAGKGKLSIKSLKIPEELKE